MSKLRLYQMFDTVSLTVFGQIVVASRDEAVVRQFTDVLSRPDTLPGQYPKDFILLHIGEQNQETGEIEPVDPQTIYTGRVWLRLKDQNSNSPEIGPNGPVSLTAHGPIEEGGGVSRLRRELDAENEIRSESEKRRLEAEHKLRAVTP